MSLSRKESSTAFFSHWFTCQDFGPLLALDLLCDAQLAMIKQPQRAVDRAANVALRLGVDVGAIFESGGDEGFKILVCMEFPAMCEG